jgi:hypothetical protein
MFPKSGQLSIATSSAGGLSVFLPQGVIALMPKLLDRVLARDMQVSGSNSAAIKMTHRKVDGSDLFFVINTQAEAWQGRLQFLGNEPFEVWNPEDGSVVKQATGTFENVTLRGYGARMFRTRTALRPARLKAGDNLTCQVVMQPLPAITHAAIGANPKVKTELEGSVERGWTTEGTLTKGNMDTHLFLGFSYEKTFSLKGSDGVVIDTDVATMQETRAELLVFIATEGGHRYLASTGRSLRVAGGKQSVLLFSQFHPFDKTTVPMNIEKITSIQVGWGGYFGREGETIRFSVKPPQGFAISN